MRQDLESRPLRVAASEQYQAALRAARIENLRLSERVHRLETQVTPPASHTSASAMARPQTIRWHSSDSAVFLDEAYLVRGVAGAILWKLVQAYALSGRRTFTNVELRGSPELRLPQRNHNLEVRLAMLKQRLAHVDAAIQLDRTLRGQVILDVRRPFALKAVDDAAPLAGHRMM